MIEHALELIRDNHAYNGMLISPEQAERIMRPTSVLVVVDTQRVGSLVAPTIGDGKPCGRDRPSSARGGSH